MSTKIEQEMNFDGKLPPYKFIGLWTQNDPADQVHQKEERFRSNRHWSCIMPEVRCTPRSAVSLEMRMMERIELEILCHVQAAELRRLSDVRTNDPPQATHTINKQQESDAGAKAKLKKVERQLKYWKGRAEGLEHHFSAQSDAVGQLRRELQDAQEQLQQRRHYSVPTPDFVRCGPRINMPRYNGMVACRIFPADSKRTEAKTFRITMVCLETHEGFDFDVRRGQVVLLLEGLDFPDKLAEGPFPSPESRQRAVKVPLPRDYEI